MSRKNYGSLAESGGGSRKSVISRSYKPPKIIMEETEEDDSDIDEDYESIDSSDFFADESIPILADPNASRFEVPKDHRKMVGLVFLYLGMCTMMPWNFMVSITTFWDYKYRNVSLDEFKANSTTDWFFKPTEMQTTFPSYLAIASNVPGAITTILHSAFGQRVSVRSRIVWSLSVLFGAFISLLVISLPNSDHWQENYMHLVIIMVVVLNVGVNVLQGAMFGVSGRFPAIYPGFVMSGQALGGVIPALAAIIFTACDIEPRLLGPACFISIVFLLGFGFVAYKWVSRSAFFLYYGEGTDNVDAEVDHNAEVDSLCYRRIFRRCWMYFLAGYLTYATTLSVFPALTSLVRSESTAKWTRSYFTPVFSVLMYNVGDLLGRSTSTWTQWPGRKRMQRLSVLIFAICRIGMIPMFMACNVYTGIIRQSSIPVLFQSDAIFCVLIAFLAISNGYMSINLSVNSIGSLRSQAEKEFTNAFLNSCFVFGIATGSCLGFLLEMEI